MSWVSLFAGFLVAHMVGDYLLQTDWQARHKRRGLGSDPLSRRALLTHVTTYTLAFVPPHLDRRELDPVWAVVAAVLIFVPHLLIDDGRLVALYLARVKRVDGLQRRARRLGRPVLPRAVAVARRDAGGRGMKRRRRPLALIVVALIAAAVGFVFDAADWLPGDRAGDGRPALSTSAATRAAARRRDRRRSTTSARRRRAVPARPRGTRA